MGCSTVLGIEEWKDPPLPSTEGSGGGGALPDNQDDEDAGPSIPSCSDGLKNGSGETDIDCGGSECPACDIGKACQVDTDCISATCSAMTGTCVIPADPMCTVGQGACEDCKASPGETDIDCGGVMCALCWTNKKCNTGDDCMSDSCMSGRCDPGLKGKPCRTAYDCSSAECDTNSLCL